MTEYIRTTQLGAALVTVINVSESQFRLADMLDVPESEWASHYATLFAQQLRAPGQCIHIRTPETSVLVDASAHNPDPESPYTIPGYQPPPGLLDRLAELGLRPEEIAHVVITHAHFDHYNGTTVERDGRHEPCFPNARHYLGRADWERAEIQEALQDPNSLESRTLAVLQRQGLLELVEGNRDLRGGVQIIATPGESPGHQMVRIQSEGQALYCIGDLYHHTVEVEQPTWMASWADVETNLASRQALTEAALSDNALLVATHITGFGCLQCTASGLTWVAAQM